MNKRTGCFAVSVFLCWISAGAQGVVEKREAGRDDMRVFDVGRIEGDIVFIESRVKLEKDAALPRGVALAFSPGGLIEGTARITGDRSRILADAGTRVFGEGIELDGTWDCQFEPQWFGAVYDGVADCTAAIQACLDRRGLVRLCGSGTALISRTLFIQGGTELRLDPGFTVRLADDSHCVMLSTRWADQRYFEGEFPDFVTDPAFQRFVSVDDGPERWKLGEPERNIAVSGGTWDANGGRNPRQDYLWGTYGHIGMLMTIVNVDGFALRDTVLYDANTYFFDAGLLTNFEISNIHMDMRELRYNQDGIHLEGDCHNGLIHNITGRTNDDMVALNGGDSFYPKYPPGGGGSSQGYGDQYTLVLVASEQDKQYHRSRYKG